MFQVSNLPNASSIILRSILLLVVFDVVRSGLCASGGNQLLPKAAPAPLRMTLKPREATSTINTATHAALAVRTAMVTPGPAVNSTDTAWHSATFTGWPQMPAVSVLYIGGDGALPGTHRGDFVIGMPPELGFKVEQILVNAQRACPVAKSRRRDVLGCVASDAVALVKQAVDGGPLAQLVGVTELPYFSDALESLMETALQQAKQAGLQGTIAELEFVALIQMAVILTYSSIIDKQFQDTPSPSRFIISSSNVIPKPPDPTTTPKPGTTGPISSLNTCPAASLIPYCDNCGGGSGDGVDLKCNGIATATYFLRSCPCIDPPDFGYAPFTDMAKFSAAVSRISNLPTLTATTSEIPATATVGPVVCNPTSYADGCSWSDVHQDWVDGLAEYMGQQFTPDYSLMNMDSDNFTRDSRDGGRGGTGVIYMMNVGWIDGCLSEDEQRMDRPLDPNQPFDWTNLLKQNYYSCTGNNGLGGYTDVGCLRYGFFPSVIGSLMPQSGPPQYSDFWSVMHYCNNPKSDL